MWNVQCIEVCRASFITNLPFSPVRWLKDKSRVLFVSLRFHRVMCMPQKRCERSYFLQTAKDFSPEFLFSSAWFCRSWSPPPDLACQTCLQWVWNQMTGNGLLLMIAHTQRDKCTQTQGLMTNREACNINIHISARPIWAFPILCFSNLQYLVS